MDQIRNTLERLSELNGEELEQLLESIVTEFESVDAQELSPQVVDSLTELAAALDTVKAEKSRREEELAELSRRRDEATAKFRGAVEDTVAEDNAAEVDSVTEAAAEATPAEEESSAQTELTTEEVVEASTPETELAAAAVAEPEAEVEVEAEAETEVAPEAEAEVVAEAEAIVEDAATEEAEAVAEVTDEEVVDEAAAEEVAEVADAGAEATLEEENPGKDPEATTVTAAANEGPDVQAPADRRPKAKTTASVAITAGADIPGVTAGSELPNMKAIAEAMTKRMHGMRNVHGGDGEQYTVASLVASFPEDRVLRAGDSAGNAEKIEKVVSPQAITAAGGYCAPVEVMYDIFGFGVTDRPVKDSLAVFNADRGGIQWTDAPVLGDITTTNAPASADSGDAISVWTKDNDSATAGSLVKPSYRVTCKGFQTAYIDALPMQLTVGNLVSRAYPELVQAYNDLALVTFARFAENRLLSAIGSGSTAVTAGTTLGAARDFFNQVDRAAVAYRQRHRLDQSYALRVIVPVWLKNLVRADLVMQMPGSDDDLFALADAKIAQWFRARGVNPTYHMDGPSGQDMAGAQSAGALNGFPTTVDWYLFAEGTWLFLDGGTLDLGLVRDSSLNATNDYKLFVETFESVAKRGIESVKVTSTIEANGTASALTAV